MIKADELQIGDWVQNPFGYKVQVLDIHYIKDEGDGYGGGYRIHIGKSNWECVQWLEEKDIEPIPLTPEILEENGFDYMGNCHYDYEDGYGQLVRYDTFNRRLKITRDLDIIFDSGDYAELMLHELQHTLKLCGINKDIRL